MNDHDLIPTNGTAVDAELLTTAEVAAWPRVSQPTLRRWRGAGEGPTVTWRTASLPRYLRSDVAAWLRTQRSMA